MMVISVTLFNSQIVAFLGVEGDGADGCYDDQHAARHGHEQHDDVFGAVHQFLLLVAVIVTVAGRLTCGAAVTSVVGLRRNVASPLGMSSGSGGGRGSSGDRGGGIIISNLSRNENSLYCYYCKPCRNSCCIGTCHQYTQ